MLTIYGNPASSPCNKVRYTAELLGLPFTWKEMDFRSGEMKKPEYLKLHPLGKVPAIDDDGFTMFESGAICKYLCGKTGNDLYPKDIKKRAVVDMWLDLCVNHVALAFSKVAFTRVYAPRLGLAPDERSLNEGLDLLSKFLPVIEQRLAASPYVGGSTLSLADITLLSTLDMAEAAQVDLSPYANLAKWRKGLQAQPFWKKFH
jgi:glutathione S-transferase